MPRKSGTEPSHPAITQGLKHDQEKVRIDLVSPTMILGIGEILTFGAKKYAPYNWANGLDYNRLYRAMMGHVHAWWMGEENDPETGKPHLWHAGCCLMFLIHYEWFKETYKAFDNRPLEYFDDNQVRSA